MGVDDAVDGLGSGDGVQGRKHEMPRFRRFEGEGNGFEIAHFAHEDDIGVLAQCGAQRRAERAGIAPYLALVHEAALGLMHEFDGVFNGNDMVAALGIGVVHERGQRGGLAAPGGAGHKHEALGQQGQLAQHDRKPQLLNRADLLWDFAEHRRNAAVLPEKVGTVTRQPRNFIGEVQIARLLECLHAIHGNHFTQYGQKFLGRNNRSVHPCEVPVDPQERRIARRKVQIRTVIGVQQMKKIVYFCHA